MPVGAQHAPPRRGGDVTGPGNLRPAAYSRSAQDTAGTPAGKGHQYVPDPVHTTNHRSRPEAHASQSTRPARQLASPTTPTPDKARAPRPSTSEWPAPAFADSYGRTPALPLWAATAFPYAVGMPDLTERQADDLARAAETAAVSPPQRAVVPLLCQVASMDPVTGRKAITPLLLRLLRGGGGELRAAVEVAGRMLAGGARPDGQVVSSRQCRPRPGDDAGARCRPTEHAR